MIVATEVLVAEAEDQRASDPYQADDDGPYYTPERIDSLLRSWAALISSAEGTRSPSLAASGAQPGTGFVRDTMKSADVIADVERAMVNLPYLSLGQRVIEYRMLHCWLPLHAIAEGMRVRYDDVLVANREALRVMAAFLGRIVEDRSDMRTLEDM